MKHSPSMELCGPITLRRRCDKDHDDPPHGSQEKSMPVQATTRIPGPNKLSYAGLRNDMEVNEMYRMLSQGKHGLSMRMMGGCTREGSPCRSGSSSAPDGAGAARTKPVGPAGPDRRYFAEGSGSAAPDRASHRVMCNQRPQTKRGSQWEPLFVWVPEFQDQDSRSSFRRPLRFLRWKVAFSRSAM